MERKRKPYAYQRRVLDVLLHQQRPVILQAPTGAGKTFAALWPFLHTFRHDVHIPFPAQAIYSVPMRVLANQFFEEYQRLTQSLQLRENLTLTIQTGEQPLDPELQGDLIFATLDQTLSSLLGVPYSLSQNRANLNVGAVLGSYLVFDEFHLFPYQATQTLFHLLAHLRPLVPFVLMTATFSQTMLEELGAVLDAHVEVVPPQEARQIDSRDGRPPKTRRFFVRPTPLVEAVETILAKHRQRTLAVINTVERAQDVYQRLLEAGARAVPFHSLISEVEYQKVAQAANPKDAARPLVARLRSHLLSQPGPWVMLLHSRFTRGHRLVKELLLRALWGPEGLQAEQPSLIVVATQVVEVGLDISAEVLHTELAPAAAVLQRAGRCARYPGETGEVYLYPVPPDRQGNPNYAPYGQKRIERETVEATWEAFQKRDGAVIDFQEEQAIINEAHTRQDAALLQELREAKGEVWESIHLALTQGERGLRAELIRDTLSGRTVLVYDAPQETDEPPFGREGFSLHIGTLYSKLALLWELQEKLDLDWALRRMHVRPGPTDSDPVAYIWMDIRSKEDLQGALLLAVHPRLAAYDAEIGFRLGVVSDGRYRSQSIVRPKPPQPDYSSYRLECYHEHIAGMRRVLEQGPWKRRFAWPAARLASILNVPEEQIWQTLHLVLALHDVGKLQQEWQAWARDYQARIGQPLPEAHCLVAHTYSEKDNPLHSTAARQARPKKPNHAGEGADAALPVIARALGGRQAPLPLLQAAVAAILRHHSAQASQARGYHMHARAQEALARALSVMDLPTEVAASLRMKREAPNLERYLPQPGPNPADRNAWWALWTYFLLVRPLRLTDGKSQERKDPRIERGLRGAQVSSNGS